MTDRYAVIGNPVTHSKSPAIHAAFARETGEDIDYATLPAPLDAFECAVNAFRSGGGKGLNVTLPFKQQAARYATRLSPRARAAQAVNTLRFDADGVFGDNTDGAGLVRDLRDALGMPIGGKRVLLVGAGGAARGVIEPLLAEGPAQLVLANRTETRAMELAAAFGGRIVAASFPSLAGGRFDMVINATSASLRNDHLHLPAGVFGPGSLGYDMMYGKGETVFMAEARAAGAGRVADGLGMLVEQAAESFYVWRGVRPRTAPVLAQLRG